MDSSNPTTEIAFESIESSIERASNRLFLLKTRNFRTRLSTPLGSTRNSKFSIEQGSLQDSTRFELDRAKGSARLELDMLDAKAYIVEIGVGNKQSRTGLALEWSTLKCNAQFKQITLLKSSNARYI